MSNAVKHKLSESLKGKEPWNKGRKMSQLTRDRMRQAKTGRHHSLDTRRKMSMSHTGKCHSAKTMKILSEKLTNIPKTEVHKQKIAASQKHRHAANKALRAIEDAHKLAGPLYKRRDMAMRLTELIHQPIDRKRFSREKKTRAEVLNTYRALLREYRRLQLELSPWMKAFDVKNGRKPQLRDVEQTQIEWLTVNFKNYLLLRDKLMRNIPYLRTAMVEAPSHPVNIDRTTNSDPSSVDEDNGGSMSKLERMEVLASSPRSPDRIKNAMAAAMKYKAGRLETDGSEERPKSNSSEDVDDERVCAARTEALRAWASMQEAQRDNETPIEV